MDRDLELLFNEMIAHQQKKVLALARQRIPTLTADDILNPHDHPVLMSDPIFNYEEGILTGILSAQAAVQAGPTKKRN